MTVAFGIFSGGLDSLLAALTLKRQGIDVRLLTFVTPFFGADRAMASGRAIGLEPRPVDLTEPHLVMLRAPKYGYGRYMNPCIDCHALMFAQAGRIMRDEGGDFLFSGEVLGQRPMSQNRQSLAAVARESGFAGHILRPLSAQVLEPTAMEETGLVDRSRLLGFSGRSRKPQIALAAEWGVTNYPNPAGGCLLTDPVFTHRLKELADHEGLNDPRLMHLLKVGRHFRLPDGFKVVVGRNERENEALMAWSRPGDLILHTITDPGPVVLVPGAALLGADHPSFLLAASLTASYSDAAAPRTIPIAVGRPEEGEPTMVQVLPRPDFSGYMV